MASEWTECTLGEIVDIYDGPHATPAKCSTGPVFLGISNLVRGRIDLTNTEHLSDNDFERWTRRVTPMAGDVVFSYETRLGEAAIIPPGLRCCLGRRMGLMRGKDRRIDMRFLLYAYLGSEFQETLRSRTIHGSTVDRIPLLEMPKFLIRIPKSINEQRAIAHILGTLDDKIEMNQRMNDTLEAMAHTLFERWLVDFDEVPEGWEVRGLDEIADYLNGLALQRFPATGERFLPVIKISQLRSANTQTADRASAEIPKQYVIEDGDVLFSWSGSLEVELWCGGQGSLNQHLFKVSSRNYPKWFYYLWTRHHLAYFQGIAANKATTMGHIQRYHLNEARVFVPSKPLLSKMNRLLDPLIEKIIANRVQTRALAASRDALLPKLISGGLPIKDAERIIGEHA